MSAIATSHLTKRYGDLVAVQDLNLEVKKGEIFGFLGVNGAGKTTTVNMLTTLIRPTAGTAEVWGHDILKSPERVRQSIGIVMQNTSMEEDLTAQETIRIYGRLYSVGDKAKVDELLALMDLTERKEDLVRTFSGGMKRKLEIARALMGNPRVLFLDEPTTGLDPKSRRDLWHYIQGLNQRDGLTIFLTTHYIEEAEFLCDRVGIINRGVVVAWGTPDELKQSLPANVTVEIETIGTGEELARRVGSLDPVVEINASGGKLRISLKGADMVAFLKGVTPMFEATNIKSMQLKEVSLVKCSDYEQARVNAAVKSALDHLGGIERYVKPGDRVLLKFNLLVGAAPEKAITTHPAVVRAMIGQVRAAGATPLVGDCSGFEGLPNPGRYYSACRQSGIKQVCEEEGVELVHLSAESVEVENPQGQAFKRFTLARGVVEADVVITLPRLKTHGLTLFTGGIKINFACLPGLHKAQMHLRAQGAETFSQMLVDLLLAVRPNLTLMDAVVGMDGDGPRNGRPKQIGAILASTAPVALDAAACEMVGIEPLMVPTTRLAHEQGVGVGDLAHIEVLGEPLEAMRVTDFRLPSGPELFFRATGLLRFLQGRLVARPVLVAERCQGCWVCVEHCPAGALSKDGRQPTFDYSKCIRCYCCQELCPNDAVELRRPLLARMLGG